jgi:hypothetical protein
MNIFLNFQDGFFTVYDAGDVPKKVVWTISKEDSTAVHRR